MALRVDPLAEMRRREKRARVGRIGAGRLASCPIQRGILPNQSTYSADGLKLWSTVLVSFAATVTF